MSYSPDLYRHTIMITGASRGIGRSVAWHTAACRATVIACARDLERLRTLAEEATNAGYAVYPMQLDITDKSSIQQVFQRISNAFDSLDVLINNAGVGRFGPTREFSTQDLDDVLNVNVRGTFLCCQEALNFMLPQNNGYIINISSVVGFKGYPHQAAYTASKHAVMGLTKSLAVELQQHNIRVSAVLPGGVETELVTAARPDLDTSELMHPEDVAETVLYLLGLSDRAAVDQIYVRRRNGTPF